MVMGNATPLDIYFLLIQERVKHRIHFLYLPSNSYNSNIDNNNSADVVYH